MYTTKDSDRSVQQTVAAIQALDLDPIKLKLMDREEGQGWSREHTDRVELAYRRFLILHATHPGETLAPGKDVDRFWHGHILDTLKYAEDCDRVFGRFLHHFPYFGMRGAEDAANLSRAAAATQQLYREQFGVEPESKAYRGAIDAGSPAYCSAIRKEDASYCSAISAEGPAYCSAISKEDASYCSAISAEGPVYRGAVTADRLNTSVRPAL